MTDPFTYYLLGLATVPVGLAVAAFFGAGEMTIAGIRISKFSITRPKK